MTIFSANLGEPYKFEVREKDKAYNEALYDVLLGTHTIIVLNHCLFIFLKWMILMDLKLYLASIGDWVEESLQKDHGMVQTLIPLGVSETDVHSKVYLR
jgi:hypothetical protein